MRRSLVAAAGLCLLVTACGTTVPLASQGAAGDSGLGGPQVGASSGTEDPTASTDQGTTNQQQSASGSTGATATGPRATAGAVGSLPGSGGTTVAVRPGAASALDYSKPATGSPVEVGIMYIPDLGAASAQFGGSGKSDTDQQGFMNAAVAYMNAHGGLGGHKIKLVYYGAEIAGTKSYAQSEQEMCSMMTQDHHVVASVISNISVDNLMAGCMQKAKALFVSDGGYLKTGADWRQLSYTVSPAEVDSEVLGRQLAQYTIDKGAAKRGDTVGLVVYDAPGFRAAEAQFKKVAQANGITVVSSEIHYATSTPDLASSISAIQSAELSMAARGAKAVAGLCSGGCMGYFMQDAQSQKYFPRYVFSSIDGVVNALGTAKADQLKGAIALGWVPTSDVDLFKNPALFSDPTFATCSSALKGLTISSQVNFGIAHRVCQALLLVQAAAKGAGGTDITGTTLRDGLGKVGSSISAGSSVRSLFTPGKHWAPSGYRSLHFDSDRRAFVYDSAVLPFG